MEYTLCLGKYIMYYTLTAAEKLFTSIKRKHCLKKHAKDANLKI